MTELTPWQSEMLVILERLGDDKDDFNPYPIIADLEDEFKKQNVRKETMKTLNRLVIKKGERWLKLKAYIVLKRDENTLDYMESLE